MSSFAGGLCVLLRTRCTSLAYILKSCLPLTQALQKLCRNSAVCCGKCSHEHTLIRPYFNDTCFWTERNLSRACKLPQAQGSAWKEA